MLELQERLRKLGAFWNYAPDALIPAEVMIEEGLRWADVEELLMIFRLFPRPQIRAIWREKLIPDTRLYPHNYYLARIFFNIQNPKRYIVPLQKKYSRYERIKQSASENKRNRQ